MSEIETPAPSADRGSIWKGIGLLALLHLIQIPLYPLILPLIFIGVSQLAYLVPAVIIQGKKGRVDTVKGLWIGAGITFLVNAACFGALLASLSGNSFH